MLRIRDSQLAFELSAQNFRDASCMPKGEFDCGAWMCDHEVMGEKRFLSIFLNLRNPAKISFVESCHTDLEIGNENALLRTTITSENQEK